MIRHGRNKQYKGTVFPDFQLSRQPAKEPDVPEKYKLKGLSDEFRNLKMVLMIECECDDGKRMWPVLHLIENTGSLKKYFGQCTKVLGMGPYGPRLDNIDGQYKRAWQLKVNMSFNCCTTGALLKGLTHPNKKWYAKRKDGTYWPVGGKTTTWNSKFQNMRIGTDSDGRGTGRSPFICVIHNATGSKAGSSTLIYWDDSKGAPPPKKGVKRTVDGPVSDLVGKLKGGKAAYWSNEFGKHTMKLMDTCRMHSMNCWEDTSRVDMDESAWNPVTCEVSNKWITQDGDYYNDAVKRFETMGINMDACINHLVIEGIEEADKQEKAEMVKEAMVAEGVSPDQENKTTGIGGVSTCSAVMSGTTAGTAAKALAALEAKLIVMKEKKKRVAAQQEALTLRAQLEQMRRSQLHSFIANWDLAGLASVTITSPVTVGNLGQHAWVTMSNAFSDPNNKHLEVVSEELAMYSENSLLAKKHGAYLIALVNVGMMQRCKTFLKEWEYQGPKSIGLSSAHLSAPTLEKANQLLVPLITDATSGSHLHNIMRDQQVMQTDKLLSYPNGTYLEAL